MSISLDLSNVEETERGEYELLPVGDYDVRVDAAEHRVASTGTEGIYLTLKVVGKGPHAGAMVFDGLWFSEKALPVVKGKLRALGFTIPEGRFSLDASDLVGLTGRVRVKHEDYTSKEGDARTSARVAYYHDRDDSAPF